MSENDILYRHLRDANNVPYATLAMKVKDGTAYIGASLCSDADNFEYAEGRKKATYRLNALISGKTPQQLVAIYKDIQDVKQAEAILHKIYIISVENEDTGLSQYKLTTF